MESMLDFINIYIIILCLVTILSSGQVHKVTILVSFENAQELVLKSHDHSTTQCACIWL